MNRASQKVKLEEEDMPIIFWEGREATCCVESGRIVEPSLKAMTLVHAG